MNCTLMSNKVHPNMICTPCLKMSSVIQWGVMFPSYIACSRGLLLFLENKLKRCPLSVTSAFRRGLCPHSYACILMIS